MIETDRLVLLPFWKELGIFPSWHMNNAHRLSVVLGSTVEDEKINFLVDMS